MARPREFDLGTAVEAAMQLFWARGYDGAGLADLLAAMNISRGSFYKAFGSKKAIFLRALARYEKIAVDPAIAALTDPAEPDGIKRLERVFASRRRSISDRDRRGCMLCNSAAGPASTDEEIAEAVFRILRRLTRAFEVALGQIAREGRLPRSELCRRARGLTAAYVGIRVLTRAGANHLMLKDAGAFAVQNAVSAVTEGREK